MLKVLIADDEIHICRLIIALVNWEELDMEVIGTAKDGLEALALVQSEKPDILITDIRMPGISGLELIEKVKEVDPKIEVVIISGYAQFDYAQTAIKIGVNDYLLKPISKTDLRDTLVNIGKRCKAINEIATEFQKLKQDNKENLQQLHEKMINDFLEERLYEYDSLKEHYKFDIVDGYLQAFYIRLNNDNEHLSSSIKLIKQNVEKIFNKEIKSLCFTAAVYTTDNSFSGLLNYSRESREAIRKAIRNFIDYLESQRDLYGDIVYSVGIGNVVENAKEINYSFKNAKNASWERLLEQSGRLFEHVSNNKTEINFDDYLNDFRTKMQKHISNNNCEEACLLISNKEHEVLKIKNISGYMIFEFAESCLRVFLELSNSQDASFLYELEKAKNITELFEKLSSFVSNWFLNNDKKIRNENSYPIRIAKQYVLDNYSKNITLEEVSELVGFSVTYFSSIFKKETGEGFAKYVIGVRIEKSKEILQETRIPVAEICELVGYSDLKHFTQTFKKYTNLSPIQYRKLYS